MFFYDQKASLSLVTAAVCGGNYAERLQLLLIAESSFTPTGSFRDKMEGREDKDKEWRKRVNNYFPFFFLSIHLPTHSFAAPSFTLFPACSVLMFAAPEQNIDDNGIN